MRLQFIKLFLLIFVTLFFVAIVTDKLSQLSKSPTQHSIELEQVFSTFQTNSETDMPSQIARSIAITNLHWPGDMKAKLSAAQVVALHDGRQTFYYRLNDKDKTRVWEMGPFQNQIEDDVIEPIVIIFYFSFAVFLFLWIWPMFRDLETLNQASKRFSKHREISKLAISKTSRVYPLAQSFNQMANQLLRYMSLQRFLASTLSHDIRTPVTRIDFCLEVMDHKNFSTMKTSIQQDIDEINGLTHEFIEFSKLEEEYDNLDIKRHNVTSMLCSLTEKMQISSHKAINLANDCPLYWRFDKSFLRRAVQNVIANALTYATLQIKIEAKVIDNNLLIAIEDDGKGLSTTSYKDVTQPYVRGKDIEDLGNGYGLGLAFAKVICEWHQGNLKIEQSQSLNGLKVLFRLPNIT
ncbi:HAMP domain-containing histidine kinase [Thalassotalea litorea]|uniref:histidine kinase n=1 Tax=Thalassotalea litorea TaxID=2020715 RepID=A0A5R9IST5_9GAMM|nr:HAMP domain-containing sensor histidine kinase [Thalassotalea litorea]TLU67563.1 HAMP domain-containing histidine kinase [Thalassotalea litorea]